MVDSLIQQQIGQMEAYLRERKIILIKEQDGSALSKIIFFHYPRSGRGKDIGQAVYDPVQGVITVNFYFGRGNARFRQAIAEPLEALVQEGIDPLDDAIMQPLYRLSADLALEHLC